MRFKSLLAAVFGILLSTTAARAQGKAPSAPWRGAGPTPCVGSDGGVELCPQAPRVVVPGAHAPAAAPPPAVPATPPATPPAPAVEARRRHVAGQLDAAEHPREPEPREGAGANARLPGDVALERLLLDPCAGEVEEELVPVGHGWPDEVPVSGGPERRRHEQMETGKSLRDEGSEFFPRQRRPAENVHLPEEADIGNAVRAGAEWAGAGVDERIRQNDR